MAQTRATPTSAARRARSRGRPTSPNNSGSGTLAARTKSPASPSTARSPSRRRRATSTTSSSSTGSSSTTWAHAPSQFTLTWLVASVMLVFWDTGYVLLRPHTMPGGTLHSPLWKPYALYGSVDYMYGWQAFHARNGFTGAQAWMNLVESTGYTVYLYMVFAYGAAVKTKGKSALSPPKDGGVFGGIPVLNELSKARMLTGRYAARAALLLYSAALMTLAKTILYMLNEVCSGYANVGHNDIQSLVFLFLLPNGMWILVPAYLLYFLTQDLLRGLELAASGGGGKRSR